MHRQIRLTVLALLVCLLAAAQSASAEARRTYTGTIDNARYRVEVPQQWNGTLVVYSHGYFPQGFPDFGIGLTNRPPDRSETERWLLEHGYAMAASQFQNNGIGYQVHNALRDQIALRSRPASAAGSARQRPSAPGPGRGRLVPRPRGCGRSGSRRAARRAIELMLDVPCVIDVDGIVAVDLQCRERQRVAHGMAPFAGCPYRGIVRVAAGGQASLPTIVFSGLMAAALTFTSVADLGLGYVDGAESVLAVSLNDVCLHDRSPRGELASRPQVVQGPAARVMTTAACA